MRPSVPGEFEALTITAWVRVQGLDRQINSLFMSDEFSLFSRALNASEIRAMHSAGKPQPDPVAALSRN